MDKHKALALFMSAIESGSFAGSAKQHGTDPSTVSKAIKRLEADLQVQLFHRSTRQLRLTSAGQQYADTVGELYRQLAACEQQLKSEHHSQRGVLKINLPVSYGRNYVVPMLCQFRERYPDIRLDVSFNDEYVDMIGQGIDIAIRSGRLTDNRLVAQKLSPMTFVLCAGQPLLASAKIDMSPATLSVMPWLRFRFKQTGKLMPVDFSFQGERFCFEPEQQTIVDDGEAMSAMCAAGAGLMIVPHFSVRQLVVEHKIQVLAELDEFPDAGVYIIYPKREFMPKRSKLFVDYLKQYLAQLGESRDRTWLNA